MLSAMDWLRRLECDRDERLRNLRFLALGRSRYLGFARARLASDADAEDVLQRAFLRAVDRVGTLEDGARAEAWFYRILRRAVIDFQRSRASERARFTSEGVDVEEAASPALPEPACGCGRALLGALPPGYAEILERVDAHSEPIEEVASSLGITPGNAYVRLHRARRALRERVEHRCGVTNAREALACACEGCA
ncbi:MAG TPA: sigma factor [Polyangiaceae bacterium]|jgi:RNA polymerase sigma-70 factor (ECF subfamily)